MSDEVKTLPSIPYIYHESVVCRQERTIRRLWILAILIFLALVASNAAWIISLFF